VARNCPREARTGFPAGLYENILSKGNSGRNEAGAGHSSRSEVETACSQSSPQGAEGGNSQQKQYEKCGLVLPESSGTAWMIYLQQIQGGPQILFNENLLASLNLLEDLIFFGCRRGVHG